MGPADADHVHSTLLVTASPNAHNHHKLMPPPDAVYLQGTVVMMCALPLALAKHTFGPDAAEFRPQRWLDNTPSSNPAAPAQDDTQDDTAAQRDTTAPAPRKAEAKAAAAGGPGLPDPLTFMTGPRDW